MLAADYALFADALCDARAPLPPLIARPEGTDPAGRFAVYRNNIHVGLVECLASAYPVVRAHSGGDFFDGMARAYVQDHKPAHALLTHYGESFPDFIASFEPAGPLPWLADLARVERAWTESWAAADAPALPITALRGCNAGDLLQARVVAHPAARLVRSPWPVASLWQAHQSPTPDLSTLAWMPEDTLLTRPVAEVRLQRVGGPAAGFIAALMAGDTIEAAAARSRVADPGAHLLQLFHAGFLEDLHR